jgi:hypothetical protein
MWVPRLPPPPTPHPHPASLHTPGCAWRALLLHRPLQFLDGSYRFPLDSVVDLAALLLQAYRGDWNADRDTTDSVGKCLKRLVPEYALNRGASQLTREMTEIDPLAPLADALPPIKMADRILSSFQGACVWAFVCVTSQYRASCASMVCCAGPRVCVCALVAVAWLLFGCCERWSCGCASRVHPASPCALCMPAAVRLQNAS